MAFRQGRCAGSRRYGRFHAWLLWLAIAAVLSSPIGATLHAMTHVEAALSAHDAAQPVSGGMDGRLDHCHDCSVWNALGCLLSAHLPELPVVRETPCYFASSEYLIDIARCRWFMQRAPPL